MAMENWEAVSKSKSKSFGGFPLDYGDSSKLDEEKTRGSWLLTRA